MILKFKINNFFERNRKYFVVFGGFLVQLTFGNFYASSTIRQQLFEYMNNHSLSKDFITYNSFAWIYCLMFFGLGTSFSLGGYIERKIGPSMTVLIGGWFMSINVCLTFVTLKSYLSMVIISYGLFVGIGMGIAYGSTFRPACTWFPKRRGLAIGVVLSGLALSPSIFNSIQEYFIHNKDNTNSDRTNENNNLPESFLFIGLVYIVLQFTGSLLLVNKPNENTGVNVAEDEGNIQYSINILRHQKNKVELQPHQLLFEFDFWILWLICLLNATSVILLTNFIPVYLKLPNTLKVTIIVTGIFSSVGRLLWGYLIDRKSFKVIMVIISLLSSVFIGTFSTLVLITNTHILNYMYTIWLAILYFSAMGCASVYPAVCANLFGMKNLIINYGMIFTAFTLSSAIISIALASPQKNSEYLTCRNVFLVSCILSLLNAGLALLFRGKSLMVHAL